MFRIQCRVGAYKPVSTRLEKMMVFGITPKGEEIPFHTLIQNGLIKMELDIDHLSSTEAELRRDDYTTNLRFFKIFIQSVKAPNTKMFWSWIVEMDNDSSRTILYSFGRNRSPLFFAGNYKILTKEEILTSNIFQETTKDWVKDELYKPAQATLDELVFIEKKNPKEGIRRIHIRKEES